MKTLEIQSSDLKEALATIKDYIIRPIGNAQWKVIFECEVNGEEFIRSFYHTDASVIDELNKTPYNDRLEFIFTKYEQEVTECLQEMLYFQKL